MVFEPIKGANAIAEVIFFFQFENEFDPELTKKFIELEFNSKFFEFFNKFDIIKGANFEFNVQTGQQNISQLKDIGVRMLKTSAPEGSEEWQLTIERNSISIHCFDYTRWEAVWKQTANFIEKLFNLLEIHSCKLQHAGLRYVDQFTYNGDLKEYRTSELFNTDSEYLHKKAFSSGAEWHCFTGWMDNNQENTSLLLNQLHIGSSFQNTKENHSLVTFIDHLQTFKALPVDYKMQSLFQTLHNQNKSVMVEILKPCFCNQINLKLEGEKI